MIKINLLGEEAAVDYTGRFVLFGYAGSVVISILACLMLYTSASSAIEERKAEVQSREAELNKLKIITKEVHELEAKRAELRDKLAVIATLKRNKVGPVRVMDDLNKAVPERAWLTEVREKDGVLSINGMALDEQTVATFMRGLEASDYFGTVDLVESKKTPWKGVKISRFSIDAKVNYSGKVLAPAPAGNDGTNTAQTNAQPVKN